MSHPDFSAFRRLRDQIAEAVLLPKTAPEAPVFVAPVPEPAPVEMIEVECIVCHRVHSMRKPTYNRSGDSSGVSFVDCVCGRRCTNKVSRHRLAGELDTVDDRRARENVGILERHAARLAALRAEVEAARQAADA